MTSPTPTAAARALLAPSAEDSGIDSIADLIARRKSEGLHPESPFGMFLDAFMIVASQRNDLRVALASLCDQLDAAREDLGRLNQACADVATQRDTALAEAARLRALVVEACDIADMLASLMPSLYRQEFRRRYGIRLAAIRTEAPKENDRG